MDSKQKIAEQIIRLLSGGEDNGRWDRREIILSICQVRDTMAVIAFYEAMKNEERDIDEVWLSTYKGIISAKDNDNGQWYIELPATPIVFPRNKGINTVSFAKDIYSPFMPMSNTSPWLLKESGTQIVDLLGNIGYYQEGSRLYFIGLDAAAPITVTMVANASAIPDHDFFPVAPDKIQIIIEKVVALYGGAGQKPMDVQNKDIPT